VFCALGEFVSIATLDLRIDYLRPTPSGRDIVADATCYRLSRQIAFTRCTLRLGDDSEIRAIATGTFICGSRRPDSGLPGEGRN
jgi:acyl-coenzyme A thioesterase PaaI-like protein